MPHTHQQCIFGAPAPLAANNKLVQTLRSYPYPLAIIR